MADQQDPPAAPPVAATAPPAATTTPTIKQEVEQSLIKGLWSKYGILFILVGLGLLVAKFGDIAMSLLASLSKKELQDAQKTDTQLKAQENAANQQADALVKKADELPSQEGKVDDDWDKK